MKKFTVYGIKGTKGVLKLNDVEIDNNELISVCISRFDLGMYRVINKETRAMVIYKSTIKSYCLCWIDSRINSYVFLPIEGKNVEVFRYVNKMIMKKK